MPNNPFIHNIEKPKSSVFKQIIEGLVIALTVNVVIYFLFIVPSQVDGPSMLPNLHDKELLFANKTPTWFNNNTKTLNDLDWDYKRGDIIIFDYQNIVLVKRIIGLSGDKISINDGEVYLNGKMLIESYLPSDTKTYLPQFGAKTMKEGEEITVPENYFFVLGDNRAQSKDSRYKDVGFIQRDKIKGIVFFRFWPLNQFGVIPRGEFKD